MASLYFLSCSALTGMTLQLLACLARVQLLATCKSWATREIQSWVPIFLHNLEHFFTLFCTLSLHDSHINTRLLITKIQANLTRNKTNKMIDKIQPYNIYYKLKLYNLILSNYYVLILSTFSLAQTYCLFTTIFIFIFIFLNINDWKL